VVRKKLEIVHQMAQQFGYLQAICVVHLEFPEARANHHLHLRRVMTLSLGFQFFPVRVLIIGHFEFFF